MNALGIKHRVSLSIYSDKKSPNLSIEAIFEQVYFKPVSVQVDLFKLVDVDVDAVVFHERG